MNIDKILEEMRVERSMVEEAILALERLVRGKGKRRGRPPKWLTSSAGQDRGRSSPSKNKLMTKNPAA